MRPWQMLRCRWAARRLHRYLDGDPSMQLREAEIQRLEEHLSECENCRGLEEDFRGLRRLLRRFGEASEPDPVAVVRLYVQMAALTDRDDR